MKLYQDIAKHIISSKKRKKTSLSKISQILNIKLELLERIEEGKLDSIKNNVFDLGHLKTYLNWLNIDYKPVLDVLKNQNDFSKIKKKKSLKIPLSNINTKYLLIISVIILFFIIISWNKIFIEDLEQDIGSKNETKIENFNKPVQENFTNQDQRDNLYIISSSWVQIEHLDGSINTSKILKKGEEIKILQKPGLVLLTDNAGGINININGLIIENLGRFGETKRNIPLNIEELSKIND